MTAQDYAGVISREVSDRIGEAVRDMVAFCEKRGEPLTRQQLFALGSMPLRVTLGLDETVALMTRTYDAIRACTPGLPEWPDELADAWLRVEPSERSH